MWISFEPRIWTWICGSIFKFKNISGSVTLELKRLDPRSTQLVLDTKDLMILDVTQKATRCPGRHRQESNDMGQPSVPFGKAGSDSRQRAGDRPAAVEEGHGSPSRSTTKPREASSALQWLTEKQTSRHKPFLYTESEPIGARTWIPLQDTPQVRAPYKAKIHTDRPAACGHERGE